MGNTEIVDKKTGITRNLLGFTLAEVLIVLTIIGIVAAITIPALVNNIQDQQYKSALKKEFSVINQAYQQITVDNGSMLNALSACSNNTCFKDILKPYFKVIKECNSGTVSGNCFTPTANIKYLNNLPADDNQYLGISSGNTSGLILADGALLDIALDTNNCTQSRGTAYSNECGWITVDVNGFKGPNQWGKDIYNFRITATNVMPSGVDNDDFARDTCSESFPLIAGIPCAALYLQQ
jgi:prepilin-type N-terminal cleavage/methylation domain-containing protein